MSAPLEPSSLFDLRFLRDAQLSPDGKQIAYCVSETEADEHFGIWITSEVGGAERKIPFAGNAAVPRWSPAGDRLAFAGNGRLHVLDLAAWEAGPPLTPADLLVQGAPSWAPEGGEIAVSLSRQNEPVGARSITGASFRVDGLGFTAGYEQHIHVTRVDRPETIQLTAGDTCCSQPAWSPCGGTIAFLMTDAAIPLASYSPRLMLMPRSGGEPRELLGKNWFITGLWWHANAQRIVVAGDRDSDLTVPSARLWTIAVDGGTADCRTLGSPGSVGMRIHHDMPSWDLTQSSIFSQLDERFAMVSLQVGGQVRICRVALAGETDVAEVVGGECSNLILGCSAAAGRLLFARTDLHAPPELHSADLDGGSERRLTRLNDAILAAWPKMDVEEIGFVGADGVAVESWYLKDANRTGPLPTVMFVHGGPFNSTGHAFRYDLVLLASRGLGVVFSNFRGSYGYSDQYSRSVMGDWGARAFPDHMGTVDAAIARGLADPERLGVWGASHGGFATAWLVGHTHRFKAAIAEAATTNFETAYYLSDAPEAFARDFGGKPSELPDVYRSRSPLTYAHRCRTPTMMLHGEEDYRCPISEAEQFYRALLDAGCETELRRIPGCSHMGDSAGPLSARRAQNEALVDWFCPRL